MPYLIFCCTIYIHPSARGRRKARLGWPLYWLHTIGHGVDNGIDSLVMFPSVRKGSPLSQRGTCPLRRVITLDEAGRTDILSSHIYPSPWRFTGTTKTKMNIQYLAGVQTQNMVKRVIIRGTIARCLSLTKQMNRERGCLRPLHTYTKAHHWPMGRDWLFP